MIAAQSNRSIISRKPLKWRKQIAICRQPQHQAISSRPIDWPGGAISPIVAPVVEYHADLTIGAIRMIDGVGEITTQPAALRPEAQSKLEIAQRAEAQAKQVSKETQETQPAAKQAHLGNEVDVVV
jgi:hypothetical protein